MRSTPRNLTLRVVAAVAAGGLLAAATPALAATRPAASPTGEWRTTTNGVRQTITFTKDGKVFGDAGCNRFTGGYTTKGSQIFVGPLASTMMACPDAQMRAEATFLKGLQEITVFSTTPRTVKLTGPTQTLVLRPA